MLTDLNATPTEPGISKKNFYIDEPNPTIQNDCLGRGQFISAVTVRGDADEVLDGDAEGRDRRGGDSRTLVSALCWPVSQAMDQTSVRQYVLTLCLSCIYSSVWAIRVRQAPLRKRGRHELASYHENPLSFPIVATLFPPLQ